MRFYPSRQARVIACLCTATLALGFFLGRSSRPVAAPVVAALPAQAVISPVAENAPAPALVRDTADAVRALQQKPATPAGEQALCDRLRQLAATDPLRALELAATAPTPRQRELLRSAALKGWATRDPRAAADWTLANVRSEDRRVAGEAIADGAIERPEAALEAFQHLVAADPLNASDHGNALVTAFARAGDYEIASRFAAAGSPEYRSAWLCTAFHQWANYQPQAALLALEKIQDPTARLEARAGLYAGWSGSDPAALVAHAQTLPIGDARLHALNDGLAQWVHQDPVAASAWMDKFDPAPDLDSGAAAIAVSPALVKKKPDVAASWAESITDPELRANTLLDLIQLWAQYDAEGAKHYARTSAALRPETRELALSALQPSP